MTLLSPAPGCPQHHVLGLPAAPRPRFALSTMSSPCLQFALSTVSLVCPQLMSLACPVGVDSQCFVAVHLANPAAAAGGCPAMEEVPPSLHSAWQSEGDAGISAEYRRHWTLVWRQLQMHK